MESIDNSTSPFCLFCDGSSGAGRREGGGEGSGDGGSSGGGAALPGAAEAAALPCTDSAV